MNILIIFNHPYQGSFCNAILSAVTKGLEKTNHNVKTIHLDKDGFNPVMTEQDLKAFRDKKPTDPFVLKYKNLLEDANHLVFIFPIWWEVMPAMMKGFIDKVIFPGVAYDYTNIKNTRMKPLLTNIKGITIISTMNTPAWIYRFIFGNAIQRVMVRGVFWKLGYKNIKWIKFSNVKSVSKEKRKNWLNKTEIYFSKLN